MKISLLKITKEPIVTNEWLLNPLQFRQMWTDAGEQGIRGIFSEGTGAGHIVRAYDTATIEWLKGQPFDPNPVPQKYQTTFLTIHLDAAGYEVWDRFNYSDIYPTPTQTGYEIEVTKEDHINTVMMFCTKFSSFFDVF